MSKLLFIKNIEELNYIQRNARQLLRTHKIIAICSLPWLELRGQGFSPEQISDYVSVEEFESVLKEARLLSQEWYKTFEPLLDYRGINLGELVRIEQIWFFRELICSYLALQRVVEVNMPGEIVLFADLDIPSLDIFRYTVANDIFAAMAIWVCENKKISVHKLFLKGGFRRMNCRFWRNCKRKVTQYLPLLLIFYNYFNRLIKTIIYRCSHPHLPLLSLPETLPKKLALAVGSTFECLILRPVMQTLSDQVNYDAAFMNLEITFDVLSKKNRSGLDLDTDTDLKFVPLEDISSFLIPERIGIISSLQKARKCFASDISFKNELLPPTFLSLLKNPYLDVQFDFLWSNYFYNAVLAIDSFHRAYRKWNPDLVVISNAMGYCQRIAVKLASNYGIKTITVPHGWVGDIDEYEFESDLFLAWGNLSREQLIKEFNKSAEDIAVVGAIQFEKFVSPLKPPFGETVRYIKEKFGLRIEARVILIITGGLPQSAFSAVDMKTFFESWEFIKIFIGAHPNIDFIIRPHPAEEITNWYRKLVRDFNQDNLKIIEEAKLEAFLPAVDVAISMGLPSTAGYLCLLFSIPLVVFKNFIIADCFSTIKAWNEDNGLLVAKENEDLASLITHLLNDNSFRKQTLEKEQVFLDKSLFIRDGKVKEKIIKAVEKLGK